MRLTSEQIDGYHRKGFLLIESVFSADEVRELRNAFRRDREIPGEHRVLEDDGRSVRAVYASHVRQPSFAVLVRSPRLLEPARQLLGQDLYVYQFKINAKSRFAGAGWAWHQDYAAWKIADGLRAPRLLNATVFLDDITEFNGPIVFLPGTHLRGLVRDDRTSSAAEQHLDPNDIALPPDRMVALADEYGMESAKGPAGSVAFFGPEIVHGSAQNVSPSPRAVVFVTYNDVANQPPPDRRPRPEYLVGRDTRPLELGPDLALAGARSGNYSD